MTQFKADHDILTTADSGRRDPLKCQYGVFHTTEDPEGKDPRATARWQQDPANDSSYNVLFGHDGTSVRSNDDNYQPWSVGQPGNRLGIHGAAVGRAARTRQQWMDNPRQLEAMARWTADLHTRYGLPLIWLTPADIQAGVRGFTSHANYWDSIGKQQGMDVRTDPGAGFPHDVVLARARAIASGADDDQGADEDAGAQRGEDQRLDLALDQLVGAPWHEWRGWPQLGDRSIVDALAAIGAALEVEGFKRE